ncbi:MAG TPA: serine protease [Dokdonella sp.]|nr:serine protease [Dokdonella sp.]
MDLAFPRRLPALLLFAILAGSASAQSAPAPSRPPAAAAPSAPGAPPVSAAAEGVYSQVRPSLLQIRTLVSAAGRQSSIGSGFLVGADGLAVTNYHVVSQYALEPNTYRLEFKRPDGREGALELLAIDIANDLAVVRLDGTDLPHLAFDPRALEGELPRGERAYAMGNPLDLGFTIVEGTWNGLVERSYNERVHFTGAINPGMSGGPAVDAAGRVVGVNVAKRLDGELVSFLVPARKAAALVERARSVPPIGIGAVREEIDRQLLEWQAGFYGALIAKGWRSTTFGPYLAPESEAPWFNCWAQTNAENSPKPRARLDGSTCSTSSALFVAEDIQSGSAQFSHAYVRSTELDSFQFSTFVSQLPVYRSAGMTGAWQRKRMTRPECEERFVAASPAAPALHAVWCARAYRDFADLYDVALTLVTQDRDREALVSRLVVQGIAYDNALALGRRFMEGVAWAK